MSEISKEEVILPELDGDQLWSWNRAKRGGLTTAKLVGAPIALITIGSAVELGFKHNFSPLIDHGFNSLIIMTEVVGLYSATGALIDGFRPTSRLVKKQVEDFIKVNKDIKNDLISAKNNIVRGANYLKQLDYGSTWKNFKKQAPQAAYDLLRPKISQRAIDQKNLLLTENTILGATYGGGMFGALWIAEQGLKLSDRLFPNLPPDSASETLSFITQHPAEIIGGSTALFLALTAYPLLFHRPVTPNQNELNK